MRPARLCKILLISIIPYCSQALADPRVPDGNLDFACNFLGICPVRTVPGGPDRDVRPFVDSLGRPCARRDRPTPEGTRHVRACW